MKTTKREKIDLIKSIKDTFRIDRKFNNKHNYRLNAKIKYKHFYEILSSELRSMNLLYVINKATKQPKGLSADDIEAHKPDL